MSTTIVRVIDAPRVVRVGNLGISGLRSVTDEAALLALPARLRQLSFVETYRSLFRWAADSALPPIAGEVIQGVGGQWLRLPIADPSWAREPEWRIDPVGGDDQSTTPGTTSLKTFAELRRRLSGQFLRQRTVVRLMGDASSQDVLIDNLAGETDCAFVIASEPSSWTAIAAGTLTGVKAISRATNPPNAQQVSDSAIADWTPYVGARIRLTSGPNAGASAFIAKDLGGNEARTTAFTVGFDPSTETMVQHPTVAPAVGDQYTVETLPGVGGFNVDYDLAGRTSSSVPRMFVDSIEPGKGAPSIDSHHVDIHGAGGLALFTRCRMHSRNGGNGSEVWCQNTLWLNGFFWNGGALASGGALKGLGTTCILFGVEHNCSNLRNDFMLQGVLLGGQDGIRSDWIGFSIWDTTGTAIELFAGQWLEITQDAYLYGSHFGDDGIQIEPGSIVRYSTPGTLNLRAITGHDFEIGPDSVPFSSDDLAAQPDGSIWDIAHNCGIQKRGSD